MVTQKGKSRINECKEMTERRFKMIKKEDILSIIPENVQLGIIISDSKKGESITHNETIEFPLASLSKFIASIFALKVNAPKELIHKTISNHDHESYVKLLDYVSIEEQNKELIPFGRIRVDRNNRSVSENSGTPKGIYNLLVHLINGQILNDTMTSFITKCLLDQSDPDGFKLSGKWSHMTGGLEGVCNDIGFIQLGDRVITVVGLVRTIDPSVEWNQLELLLDNVGQLIKKEYGT